MIDFPSEGSGAGPAALAAAGTADACGRPPGRGSGGRVSPAGVDAGEI